MPRAFLVKKTRGTFLDKSEAGYDADCLGFGESKSARQNDFRQNWHDVPHNRQDQNIIDRQTNDQIQNYSTFFKDEEALTVLASNRKKGATRSSHFTRSSHPASGELGGLVEPMDLSQVKPTLCVSYTSAFEHVGHSLRVIEADDTKTTPPKKSRSLKNVCSQDNSLPFSTSFTHELLDEPLDLQVRRREDVDSPQSSGIVTSDKSVPPLPVRYYDTCAFEHNSVEGPTPASALNSMIIDGAAARQTALFRDVSLSLCSNWIHRATDRRSIPYFKQEPVTILTNTTSSHTKQDRYGMSQSYPLDKYIFPTDINNHTDVQHMQTLSQQPMNTSPVKGNHMKIFPQLPITDTFSVQHMDLLRRSEYQQRHPIKRSARQPVMGLEYIQNTPNFQDNGSPNADTMETQESDIQETNISSQLEPVLSPTLEQQHTSTDVDYISTEDISSPAGKAPSSTAGKPTQYKKYICDVCGKGFSRSNTLVTHKRIHTGDKPFKCELCGRAFRQPGNLTRHRLTHTTVKPYVCQQCGKAFNRASNLHTHMRTHTNYKPFVCQYCGKGFHQKIDMKIHSYTHTGEKPHKCKKCGRGFKQLTHLTYHMRTHSEIKMFTCAYCGKGFNQKGNLQAHIYGHTGERPYHCEICNKGFTLASTLNTHRRTHADRKPYTCQYCGKDFYQKNALKSHMITSHPFSGKSLL